MRRRRSDELPRFASDAGSRAPSQWHGRYWYYLAGFLFVCWCLYPTRNRAPDDGDALHVNWSRFAYSLYATDSATLCHAVLIFDALATLGSKADRVLFYPMHWDTVVADSKDRDSQLLIMARDKYQVKLQPIKLLTVEGRTTDAWTGTWDKSVTKFMAFSLGYYDRVIALDSDLTLLQSLDELFLLPQTPVAMPRAYWYDTKPVPLTSLLMVVKPDVDEFDRFRNRITGGGNEMIVNAHKFDMELVNERFEDSAMVLPHRPFALLSGEFRRHNHSAYLGSEDEAWDADKVFQEAKLVHFSDWPLPKPWIMWPQEGLAEMQPDCGGRHEDACPERRIWKHLYEDFRARRKKVCRLLSVPAPEWWRLKGGDGGPDAIEGTEDAGQHAEGEADAAAGQGQSSAHDAQRAAETRR